MVCGNGTCGCAPGTVACGSPAQCVVLASDPRNCGACGTTCAAGQVCSGAGPARQPAGRDSPAAEGPASIRGRAPATAEAARSPARPARAAPGSMCACSAGESSCVGVCTRTTSDPLNCGGCGVQVPGRPGVHGRRLRRQLWRLHQLRRRLREPAIRQQQLRGLRRQLFGGHAMCGGPVPLPAGLHRLRRHVREHAGEHPALRRLRDRLHGRPDLRRWPVHRRRRAPRRGHSGARCRRRHARRGHPGLPGRRPQLFSLRRARRPDRDPRPGC